MRTFTFQPAAGLMSLAQLAAFGDGLLPDGLSASDLVLLLVAAIQLLVTVLHFWPGRSNRPIPTLVYSAPTLIYLAALVPLFASSVWQVALQGSFCLLVLYMLFGSSGSFSLGSSELLVRMGRTTKSIPYIHISEAVPVSVKLPLLPIKGGQSIRIVIRDGLPRVQLPLGRALKSPEIPVRSQDLDEAVRLLSEHIATTASTSGSGVAP